MLTSYLHQIVQPEFTSHKGENGKVLIIGGSDLFHAASQWAFKVVSRFVDMTFYTSVVENNDLIRDAKFYGHDGVVIPRSEFRSYLEEADAVLIGPGMRRDQPSRFSASQLSSLEWNDLSPLDWEYDTQAVTSVVLRHYPQKKWVIDAGALQVVELDWLPPQSTLTPHPAELRRLLAKIPQDWSSIFAAMRFGLEKLVQQHSRPYVHSYQPQLFSREQLQPFLESKLQTQLQLLSQDLHSANIIVKGPVDLLWNNREMVAIFGGNAGMTKGGTGDVLAGLTTAFMAKSPAFASLVTASYLNKLTAHSLYQQQGIMYNTSDVVEKLPIVWHQLTADLLQPDSKWHNGTII